jgi:hypothetical protein
VNRKFINRVRFFINRSGIGYFAPLIALIRLIKKRRLNYLHQMKVVYRYAYWKWHEPKFETYTHDEFIEAFYPGKSAQYEADRELRKDQFLKSLQPKTARPTDLREKLIINHNEPFLIRWRADFEKQELLIFTTSLWVPALTDFLIALPAEDQRVTELGIADSLQIDASFTIKLCFEYQDMEKWYLAHVSMFLPLLRYLA